MIKFYKTGEEFIEENEHIFAKYSLENPFMKMNAKYIGEITLNEYMFKVEEGDKYLLCVRKYPFNLILFGDVSLVKEASEFMVERNLKFSAVLADFPLGDAFLKEYTLITSSTYKIQHDMSILECKKCENFDSSIIEKPSKEDKKQIIELLHQFSLEALGEDFEETKDFLNKLDYEYDNYYVIKEEGNIISMAKATRENEDSCSISSVYTLKEKRGLGLCRKLVGYITQTILNMGKRAYLYVDNFNPISNRVYRKIGYQDLVRQVEFRLIPSSSIKTILLAGGCFWCASKPFYEYEGVKKVLSGYAGGKVIEPTYEMVKHQETDHRETILVQYDSSIISFEKIIDIYFDMIDPFDNEGQFIDKGKSYTLAIYTSSKEEREYLESRITSLEKEFERKIYISIEEECIFYKAEEYHQDFAKKNPSLMEEELIASGRKK